MKRAAEHADAHDVPTRVASVCPQTGTELERPRPLAGIEGDATVLLQPSGDGAAALRPSAELVPRSGQRATGELTAVWSKESGGFARASIRRLWERCAGLRRRRVILVGAAFLAALAAAFAGAAGSSATDRAAPSATRVALRTERLHGEDRTPPATPLIPLPEQVRLADATRALLDGRLADAHALYASLRASRPGDRSIALACDILERALKERTP